MFSKKPKTEYGVTLSFDKKALTNLYDFAKLKFEDTALAVDWAGGNVCRVSFCDVLSAKIVNYGIYFWIEITSKQLVFYVSSSKNKQILQQICEKCGL